MVEHTDDTSRSHKREDCEVRAICDTTISLIPRMGISNATLREACRQLNLENSFCKFPGGVNSVLEYFHEDLIDSITHSFQSRDPAELPRVRDRIYHLLELCILYNASVPNSREFVKSVLRFSLLPSNTCFFASLVFRVMDAVWHLAGDSSTNFSYYTKRLTAASVYVSSLVYFAQDHSENVSETLSFMGRRINGILKFQKLKNSAKNALPKIFRAFDVRFN
ncbi:COQ9 family protein [Anaplasma capra]|uniref:COQ9 family protein n=1 Tax=Anaplasma capra TaxID=1562740 RepID=UPI0021D60836|nr:COQ9 family protein [Anaplasma capra]MCU7611852.1 COQ9 family protein [Anaplasma capra]MCU7612672.1 COQ9 family protein [Anaplasma capra]